MSDSCIIILAFPLGNRAFSHLHNASIPVLREREKVFRTSFVVYYTTYGLLRNRLPFINDVLKTLATTYTLEVRKTYK